MVLLPIWRSLTMTLPSKRGVSLSLKAIRVAIIRNHMNMDSSAHGEALHAIWHYFMDEGLRCIQCDASTVKLWTVQDQLAAVKMLCTFLNIVSLHVSLIQQHARRIRLVDSARLGRRGLGLAQPRTGACSNGRRCSAWGWTRTLLASCALCSA